MSRRICSDEGIYHSAIRLSLNIPLSLSLILLSATLAYGLDKNQFSAYEDKLLRCINQYRVEKSLRPLSMEANLKKLAESQSLYMQKKNALNHDYFDKRFSKSGRSLCVENTGWNYPTPESQLKAWKLSCEHNKNLLNEKIKYAGIAKSGAYVTFFACE